MRYAVIRMNSSKDVNDKGQVFAAVKECASEQAALNFAKKKNDQISSQATGFKFVIYDRISRQLFGVA